MSRDYLGPYVTDQALITAVHPATESERRYLAVYDNGEAVSFAVGHSAAARVYAREYGYRFLGGARLVTVRWQR